MKKISIIILVFSIFSCKTARINKQMTKQLQRSFYNTQFAGVLVYNPRTKDTLVKHNATKFFTPASNTKIFTLFTVLNTLGDSIPAFKYHINADTITLQGVGNPTFLHPYFKDSTALNLTKDYAKTRVITNNLSDDAFGPGWAWEDYDTYFSPERSAFPIYGNVVTVSKDSTLKVIPHTWKNNVTLNNKKYKRHQYKNQFYYPINRTKALEIPMIMDSVSQLSLWKNLLPDVEFVKKKDSITMKIAYALPTDSVCKRMMYQSDNFLAEQLLIMASSTLSDTLSSKKMRAYILHNNLSFLQHKPRWVDGSGLSRYNLFTPKSFVQILDKLYQDIPKKRLFDLFPVGGQSGTLKKWYKGDSKPYIYAKSGSLSNNYALSGYLITNKGETLIFSFMNNHYRKSTSKLKQEMQTFFEYLRDNF